MSQLDLSGCKKRKRGEKVFKFKTFGEKGYPTEFHGSFQENVRALLEFGQMENGLCGAMASWSFQLEVHRHPSVHVFLFVVEEPIELSLNLHCKHCQYVGWGHHLICNKKYHFLLPSKDTVLPCLSYEGNCHANLTESKSNLIELEGHTMHGVFHSNGFGHLLCINGMETSSDLAGYQLMDFWDRLCTGLGARKLSLRDTSQKRGMDLRLIHAVAYGEPWFGRWGYTFGRGSYGVNQQMYRSAVDAIQNIPLSLLVHHLGSTSNEILVTLSRYQVLSGHSLVTLGDIFHFMLELKSRLPKESSIDSCNPGILVDNSCRWSPKRVEMAIKVIIEALKKAENRWISRQEVRDAARMYIGDTGLLDFVLKSLGNHIVGRYFVRRCLNPVTKVLEYCLEDISHTFPKPESLQVISDSKLQPQCRITRIQLMKDIYYLYKHMLKEHKTMSKTDTFATILVASRIILDTKYLVSEFFDKPASESEVLDRSKLHCTIVFANNSQKGLNKVMPPYECFQLRKNATFDELKVEVERTFRELYWGARGFIAESIVNFNSNGSDLIFKQIKAGAKLVFEGFSEDGELINGDICEGIKSDVVVDCACGIKEDDGERMVSCDICEIWQHTRCVNIPNGEEIPNIFLCSTCEHDILRFPSLP